MLISFGGFTFNFNMNSSDLMALLSHNFSHIPLLHNCGIFHIMRCAFLWPVDRSLCPASLVIMWQWPWSLQYSETGLKTDFGPQSDLKDQIFVLQQDTVKDCYWPYYQT